MYLAAGDLKVVAGSATLREMLAAPLEVSVGEGVGMNVQYYEAFASQSGLILVHGPRECAL